MKVNSLVSKITDEDTTEFSVFLNAVQAICWELTAEKRSLCAKSALVHGYFAMVAMLKDFKSASGSLRLKKKEVL